MAESMFSIDQNCHSLWDVLPKLQALAGRGVRARQFIEDVDVAFTQMGAAGDGGGLVLARERFYRSGGADWGAALFYFQFLGRQAVEIRQWEPCTGLSTKALAGQLGRTVDDLYEEFSPGDNWQMIGPSYVGDRRHHRVLGDLRVAETTPLLLEALDKARQDTLERFPQDDSRRRTRDWFAAERTMLEGLIERNRGGMLIDLYRHWLGRYLGDSVDYDNSSVLFAADNKGSHGLLELFIGDYARVAAIYNESIAETDSQVHPLDTRAGELPFYAVMRHQGHLVRTELTLRDGAIVAGDLAFAPGPDGALPAGAMQDAGIRCLSPKALLLVIQARLGPSAAPLVLPYRGSLYMPASHRLARKLSQQGLLPGPLRPLMRVRLGLLDRLRTIDTVVRLPPYLAAAMGRDETPASELGDIYAALAAEARARLVLFKDAASREAWQRQSFPELFAAIAALDHRRRELAAVDARSPDIRQAWKEIKALQVRLLERTLAQIARDWQVRELDYWDSRGAILPWCVALGGIDLYNELIAGAQVYEERPQ